MKNFIKLRVRDDRKNNPVWYFRASAIMCVEPAGKSECYIRTDSQARLLIAESADAVLSAIDFVERPGPR